jgi:hypothetical protein
VNSGAGARGDSSGADLRARTRKLLSNIGQTSRLLTVKDRTVRVVAVGQPCEVLTTLTVAGYLLPANGNHP